MRNKLQLLALCLLFCMQASAQKTYPFRNTKLADEKRVDNLLSLLTLDEKINLLSTDLGVPRFNIPHCGHYEGLHGLTLGGPAMWGGRERTDDGKTVPTDFPTTIFPQSYGLGSTWDIDLVRKVAEQASEEARYYMQTLENKRNSLVMRAPNADLARDPRWGRTEESFGEDPFLTAQLTIASVRGLQGDNPRYWKTASLMKHFLANSNEDGRDSTSSDFDKRLFYEYYAYPFYKGITEGGSRAFMAAYNSWNGTVMSVHPCLEEITRKQWGNNGIICTDGGALKLLVESHKAFPTLTEGAAAVVKATTGQFLDAYVPYVKEALEKGLLTEADIDKAIRGNIYVALKLGLLDGDNSENPYLSIGKNPAEAAPYTRQEAHQLAREVTAKSVVLLKNEASKAANGNKLLPLDAKKLRKIALIGPYSNKIVQDWYSGTPPYETTILSGIRNAVDKNTEILHFDDNAMGQAERAAAAADIAIVCVGNHPYGTRADWKFSPVPSDGREAVDRKSLMLPDEDLVKQVFKANPNTILVLVSSFPYTINWSQEHVPAIVHITHCSQEQGNGLADVLFGKVNPAGRTVQTWVKDITDLPDMMDYNIRHGRTYMYHKGDVLYPFGYGLSYSTFDYEKVNSVKQDKKNVNVTVSVKNTGTRDGEEVVQLYASYPNSKVERPAKQLRAFKRVPIKAGETKEVVLTVSKEDLGYWDETKQAFTVEPGTVKLLIGASSEDIRLETDTIL
ncbi:glycoside hydrolase family 3 C-terminal domain-containing protein [Bacteroides sp. GD17]|jgi:beta-glucosidase|uniref:glycoside hydrolase family 3 C-terminal domain-containing protein n=1 Tax=Bacteroides sp. GD17 TaxID=3139826 RepID=UPI0025CE7382|nr:glycoside hydrolase family 3 C-terminal domain-containing protein [uncultured Bacteroides sp.]